MIIASAQFTPRPCEVAANVEAMAGLIAEAAGAGATLVVFPELAVTGYEPAAVNADPDLLSFAPDAPELSPLREACRASAVTAVVNCPARSDHGPTITSYVYGPDGSLLTRYDKVHVTETEQAAGFVPGTADGRFTVDGVRAALAICYDTSFPDVAARAAADNCRLLLASSLHDTEDGPRKLATLYPAMARDNALYVALANHVGPSGAFTACGLSAVWGPDGRVLAERADAGLVLAKADVETGVEAGLPAR
ncbi:carbon-nitrogen hydrolase family protein [Streptomyces sp. AV19]|uniref:carbon-nitrogen hydrolase family protein n=1 Tax=Streptomyces sp. AV19 TaxID=2793068 RepID=UPI0018FE7B9E|nr:carbon-nitrogen hydrolase family protein [Streptomyces sp. AV19]MBH1933342.1 carbon-nitrogen hydrolase family protein [Streptomyces sp. AV19]MDG4531953.1 carbon-nitrogen hydrolase family protein [Streptomyces sp. AV19]